VIACSVAYRKHCNATKQKGMRNHSLCQTHLQNLNHLLINTAGGIVVMREKTMFTHPSQRFTDLKKTAKFLLSVESSPVR
jgi:hypothetical protein